MSNLRFFAAKTVLALLLSGSLGNASAQVFETVTSLPEVVSESSGIELSGPDRIWTFNDSSGDPVLYLCDTLGNLIKTLEILNAWNRDWEDITQDDQGNFYIGNIGNNSNDNTDLTIFKIPNPDTVQGSSVTAEVISFSYEDQWSFPPPQDSLNFDCEALMWFDGHLYLSTKNQTIPFDGKTHLYRLPDTPGQYVAEKIGTFDTGGTVVVSYWITAGDISPDGSKLALLSSDRMWIFSGYSGDDFFGGEVEMIEFPHLTQKEGICFVSETELYITDEGWDFGIGRKLYRLDLLTTGAGEPIFPDNSLAIYPNPCRDLFVLEGDLQGCELEIFDRSGARRSASRIGSGPLEVNVKDLPAGVFFIRLTCRERGRVWTKRMIKLD